MGVSQKQYKNLDFYNKLKSTLKGNTRIDLLSHKREQLYCVAEILSLGRLNILFSSDSQQLADDFFREVRLWNMNNTCSMHEIVCYVYSEIPAGCHGSHAIIDEWINNKRKQRMKERENNQWN